MTEKAGPDRVKWLNIFFLKLNVLIKLCSYMQVFTV